MDSYCFKPLFDMMFMAAVLAHSTYHNAPLHNLTFRLS